MSKDLTPDAWIASFDETGGTVSFPLASIATLNSGDCDATTGDIRNVLLAILTQLKAHQDGLATANKPGTMSIRTSGNSTAQTFTITFSGTASTFALAAESP